MLEDEYLPPSATSSTPVSLSRSTSAGLAALMIGCTLLISACVLMAFNVVLFRGGLGGIPRGLALFGAVLGVGSVALMGLVGVVLGLRGWSATQTGESRALGVGGTATASGGFVGWMIAGINLLIILLS
jgi:hypothetical protein